MSTELLTSNFIYLIFWLSILSNETKNQNSENEIVKNDHALGLVLFKRIVLILLLSLGTKKKYFSRT